MNAVLECIKTRRSIRGYNPDPVPRELIEKLLDAALEAPSGMNRQPVIAVAITNKQIRDKLAKDNAAVMGSASDPFYGAPAVIVVLAKKDVFTHVYDGALAMQNIMLAAHSLGLASCWIHRAKETFEMPEWQDWLRSIGVSGEYEGIGNCIIGYANADGRNIIPAKERAFIVE